jgi:hydrophobic/amphiphilic exporter-1 (mainly G- bacteria), HAE1 family
MNISSIFILRPVMTTLVMAGVLLFGLIAYFSLPLNDLPAVDFPTITVSASLPGASPETMASAVATPLEKQFGNIAGLDSMSSISQLGSSQITLQFDLSRKIDGAAEDTQAAIIAARAALPTSMPTPPTFKKVNPADFPILFIALSSDTLPIYKVDEYAENRLAPRISMINGVAQVQVFGSQIFAPHVQVDPRKMASLGIGIDEVVNAVRTANVNLPTGTLYGPDIAYNIKVNGQCFNADAFRPLIVTYKNGAPVRLGDIGDVIDSVQTDKVATWYYRNQARAPDGGKRSGAPESGQQVQHRRSPPTDAQTSETNTGSDERKSGRQSLREGRSGRDSPAAGSFTGRETGRRAIVLAVQKQPNTNTIQIVDAIKRLLPSFQAAMPGSMQLNILFDRSFMIRRSVAEVQRTLAITIVLVILVIYFFLGNVSTTVIASLSLPISILGTFAAMKLMGFTLNNISLMAITLCVGFVVDDAIVVLENIVRHMEQDMPVFEASMRGAQEVGFTILAMTTSLAAVFIPILLMGGIVGRLFFQFAVTITIAILISGFVSLSLTPMLCSRFLRRQSERKRGFPAFSDFIINLWTRVYGWSLNLALKNRDVVLATFLLTIAASWMMLQITPKGFIPSEDTGQISGVVQAIEGISFKDMVKHQKRVAEIVAAFPAVDSFMSSVGSGVGGMSANQGRLNVFLKPQSERQMTADQVIAALRKKCSGLIGVKFFMQNPPGIRIGPMMSKALYQVTISGPDLAELYKAADKLQDAMKEIESIVDLNSDLQVKSLKLKVNINRDKCSNLGITLAAVQDALNSAYAARQISTIFAENDQYWVILEVQPQYYEDPSMIDWLRVRSSSGSLIPLNTVATVSRYAGPMQVNHLGQLPSVTLSFNLKPNEPLSTAVEEIKKAARTVLPPGVTFSFQGTAQVFEASTKNLGFLLLISVLVIYIVLGILYESFIHPVTILSGLPSAGLGALITLYLCHKDLDIYGFLGLILLVGIVKKNAIMMIDFALEAQRTEGLSPEEAIKKACLVRFRPIMMTTLAALFGSVPIALGTGTGSESRQPLGLSIVGGLLLSQLVTLYVTPVFYLYLDKLEKWIAQRKKLKPGRGGAK